MVRRFMRRCCFFRSLCKWIASNGVFLSAKSRSITLNQSFALAYAHFNEATIPDDVLEKSFEDFSKDFLEFRTQLYEWLKSTPFKINFNQQLFEDKLMPCPKKRSPDLAANERNGELKLYPEAVLGIFPQAGSYLVPDYNVLLEKSGRRAVFIFR